MSFADGTEIYYPFIVRPISSDAAGNALDEELWDLYTPLVYGGPMGRCASASEIDEFWTAMRAWAQEHRIVSEIIRFTPVRRNRLPYPGTLREQAPHIVVDLGLLSEDDIIARLHKSVRRRYRKARDAGLTIRMVPDESGIDDFVLLHTETMIRAGVHQEVLRRRRLPAPDPSRRAGSAPLRLRLRGRGSAVRRDDGVPGERVELRLSRRHSHRSAVRATPPRMRPWPRCWPHASAAATSTCWRAG